MKFTTKKSLKKFLYIFIVLTVCGLLVLHFYIPKLLINTKAIWTEESPTHTFDESMGKTVNIITRDSINLSGFLTYASKDNAKGTIILLHGIRAYKEHFSPLAAELARQGYNTLAFDLRAHGSSGGNYCTFGYYEKYDIVAAVDFLIHEEQLQDIGIWGQSLGGAIALQTMSIDHRIKYGIIESTFSSFRLVAHDYISRLTGIDVPIFSNYLIDRAGKIGNFNPDDIIPYKDCEKILQPVLLVHGSKDDRISISHAHENFNHLESNEKYFLEIEGANHLNVWKKGGKSYMDRIFSFLPH